MIGKIGEFLIMLLIETFLFILILIGLGIEKSSLFASFIFGCIVLVFILNKLKPLKEKVKKIFQRNSLMVYFCIVLLALVYPIFQISNPYLIHLGAIAGIYAIMALGLNITLGFTGMLDLGYAAFYAIGAYTSVLLNVHFQWSFWFTLPIAVISAGLFSLLIGIPSLRVRGHYLALVTLAFGQIIYLLLINIPSLTKGTDGITGIEAPIISGFNFFSQIKILGINLPYYTNFYYLILSFLILVFLISRTLNNSKLGRILQSIREDEIASMSCGINITKFKLLAFFLSASLGGLSGSLYAHMIGYINPDNFTFAVSVTILCMVILGGMGNITGVVISAVILVILPEKLREFEHFRIPLFGFAMLLLMIYRPQGLFPKAYRQWKIPERFLFFKNS